MVPVAEMKTKLLYLLISVILCAGVYFLYSYRQPRVAICPDDFPQGDAGEAAQMAAIDKWTNDFYDANPGASLTAWSAARYQFWVDNNCTAALKRYSEYQAGNADPATMQRVHDGIQEAIDAHTSTTTK